METWGMVPKAQDDPQTIDEAISAAITAHLGDTNAHIEENESLYNHKHSEIIDHLAQSIVYDKIVFNNIILDGNIGSLDAFIKDGEINLIALSTINIAILSGGYNVTAGMLSTGYLDGALFSIFKNCFFSVYARTNNCTDAQMHWGSYYDSFWVGIGFFVIDGDLYCQWTNDDFDDEFEYIDYIGTAFNSLFSFFIDVVEGTITWYQDGVEIFSTEYEITEFTYYFLSLFAYGAPSARRDFYFSYPRFLVEYVT